MKIAYEFYDTVTEDADVDTDAHFTIATVVLTTATFASCDRKWKRTK